MPAIAAPPAPAAAPSSSPSPALPTSTNAAPISSLTSGGAGASFRDGDNDPFADAPPKKPATSPTPKAPDKIDPPPVNKGDEPKPADAPKPPEQSTTNPDNKPTAATGPKWFRDEIAKKGVELSTAQTRIKELETRLESTSGQDVNALTQTLAAKDQELAQVREKLGSLQFTESPEFRKQYIEPFEQAYKYAASRVKSLPVTLADGTQRAATDSDFRAIYQQSKGNLSAAMKTAQEAFGDSAQWVMGRVDELMRLEYAHDNALEGERSTWETKNKESVAKSAQQAEAHRAMLQKLHQDMVRQHPEYFGDDPQDPDGNAALKKGYEIVDALFVHGKSLTPQQQAVATATVRNRAAAFGRLVHQQAKMKEQLAEKDAIITELRGSAPGGGDQEPSKHPTDKPGGAKKLSMMDELDALTKGR